MSQQKFAVFDIDGTIYRWQLYHELFDELAQSGVISQTDSSIVAAARAAWSDRLITFSQYEHELIRVLENAIIDLPIASFRAASAKILAANGHQTYLYTKQLINDLKGHGYMILAISGSFHEMVEEFAKLHGIDVFRGRTAVITDGKLGAVTDTNTLRRKGATLKKLVAEHNLSWTDSYAVGDSDSDAQMLELVEHPIAFNPTVGLRDLAIKNRWPIVIERKSVVYRLNPANNSDEYTLKIA
ncbi:MAG TPA: HAD family phosphatase [Candidatus Saccharimonadales bacterium]|jgi:HAD superfamily hydrolase (TIGR01490 family)|nr:HAD family phosphatase [Candidatus Saccharimonadales bacterium]